MLIVPGGNYMFVILIQLVFFAGCACIQLSSDNPFNYSRLDLDYSNVVSSCAQMSQYEIIASV